MHESNIKLLLNVIQSVILGNQVSEESKLYVTDINTIQNILSIAQRHGIAHIVAYGLLNNKLVADIDNQLHFLTYK